MRVLALGVHHPFLAPGRSHLETVGICLDDVEIQPLIERTARNQLLDFVDPDAGFTHALLLEAWIRCWTSAPPPTIATASGRSCSCRQAEAARERTRGAGAGMR